MSRIWPHDSERRARLANAWREHVPPVPPGDGPPGDPVALGVFVEGVDHVQVCWRALGPGPVVLAASPVGGGPSPAPVALDADGGPGAATLHGLAPGTPHVVTVGGPGLPDGVARTLAATTLPRPPGERLHRLATLNDVHLGSRSTGFLHTMVEKPAPEVPHPLRCALAARDEVVAWGADRVVLKGDLVDRSAPEAWAAAAEVLGGIDVPVDLVPGNHEFSTRGDGDPGRAVAALGHELVRGVGVRDLPGVRLVLVDTVVPGADLGRLAPATEAVAEAAAEARAAGRPVLVAMHHQPQRWRLPTYLPGGVPGPEARRFLSTLGRANPAALVTAGHTHRLRVRRHGHVTVTEVGSTKDLPGVWGAYDVHEGGIVQVVRRIERPDVIRWTEHTRRAALGAWGLWAPGRRRDRSLSRTW